ncbi:MAG: hypothetical protein ABSG25_01815 [Bryobacteraceae bacterium]
MTNRRKPIIVAALLILCLAVPAFAQWVVFDPTACLDLIQQIGQLETQYQQLVQTYNQVTRQVNQMEFNAKRLTNPQQFLTMFTKWMHSTAPNNSGLTGQWVIGMNSTLGSGGYGPSTLPLKAQPSLLSPPALYDYANVEIADGTTWHTMDVLGNIRSNSNAIQSAIDSLEADALSDDDDGHSEVEVLDRVATANVIALKNQQDTNKLLVTLAEQRAMETKRTRDVEAQALNEQSAFTQNAPALMAEETSGLTSAMTGYSLP